MSWLNPCGAEINTTEDRCRPIEVNAAGQVELKLKPQDPQWRSEGLANHGALAETLAASSVWCWRGAEGAGPTLSAKSSRSPLHIEFQTIGPETTSA
jgi:hypothetical protein